VAKVQPIYDYHSHLSQKILQKTGQFDNITQLWIEGDQIIGCCVPTNTLKKYITGDATPL
jgi:glucuronate isomerase